MICFDSIEGGLGSVGKRGTMSEVYERYERQFCELLANLSEKCTSARVLFEEQKKQKVSEIAGEIDEVEDLIRKMDLAARHMPSSVKAMLHAKTCEYRNDLKRLKTELTRLGSSNANDQATEAELLGSGGSDAIQESADQIGRLMMAADMLKSSTDRIRESRRIMLETEKIGASILQDLQQQHESLQHAITNFHGVKNNADRSKKT